MILVAALAAGFRGGEEDRREDAEAPGERARSLDHGRTTIIPSAVQHPASTLRTRRAVRLLPALLALVACLASPRWGRTADLDDGLAALARTPPDRAAARAAFERAAASSDARTSADALYHLGMLDEEELAFAAARARYRASLDRDPSGRWAGRARAREDDLAAHAEGDFAPLARLERTRRSGATDPAELEALLAEAAKFPDGPTRAEARMLVADAYRTRLRRPADALGPLEDVARDRYADPALRRLAARDLSEALLARGERDRALAIAHATGDRALAARVLRLARRRAIIALSTAIVLATIVAAVLALGLAARRGEAARVRTALGATWPAAVGLGLLVGAGGALAAAYETGHATPFLLLGAALVPVVLLARAWGAVGAPGAVARALRGVLFALAVVAAALLVLARVNVAYLESFGL
jgi:hypothetical protein